MLAAAAAPAIVKASSLMPIYVPKIVTPSYMTLWGDGVHDDQPALAALLSGGLVADRTGKLIEQQGGMIYLPPGTYAVGRSTRFTKDTVPMVIQGSRIEALASMPSGESMMVVEPEAQLSLRDSHFISQPHTGGFEFDLKDSLRPAAPFRKTAHGHYWGAQA